MEGLRGTKTDGSKGPIYYSAAARYQAIEMLRENHTYLYVEILKPCTHEIIDRVYSTDSIRNS